MIIGIGETVLDIIFRNDQPQLAVPGGSTFNAMITLGRMGTTCAMVTETGDDHVGDIVCKYLSENGVDTSYINRNPGTKSHISLAFLNEQDDAQYQFYKDHASVSIRKHMPAVSDGDIVVFGSFFAINPVIRNEVAAMLHEAYDAGAVLYYDINFRASHIADIPMVMDNLNENMRMATVVRGSLEDFGYLYGSADVDEIYEKHIRPFCPCFICTNGSKPIELRTPMVKASFRTMPVKTVSTVGAGDNFNAGFVYGVLRHKIKRDAFADIPIEQWTPMISIGQQFSSHVCTSLYNSVSKEFASSFSPSK